VTPLEELDPELIDQAIRRLLKAPRPPHREIAVIRRLEASRELAEWVEIMRRLPPVYPDPEVNLKAMLYSAVSIGLEVGYELGGRNPELFKLLVAVRHCLKSYEYGNSATDPAKDMADRLETVLRNAGIKIDF
jgi:hypothetical protein